MVFHREMALASICATIRRAIAAAFMIVLCAAQAQAVSLLRDPDIEYALKQLAAPVLRAAGLNPNSVRIFVVNDRTLNAFVVDPNAIFINHGMILKLTTADMLQAVIAHEAAHIANGHITRRMTNLRSTRTAAGLGIALAAIAAAAGGGDAAAGIAVGAVSSAQRQFFSHTRAEESAADQSAFRYMVRAGASPAAMVEVQKIFTGQETLSQRRQDPYSRSHPMSRDRQRAAAAFASTHPKIQTDPKSAYWFARAKGKLSAFLRSPKWTLTRASEGPTKDIMLMRQAVAYHRSSNLKKSLPAINAAIAQRPKDPFLYDLKGQILMESRQFKSATTALSRAVQLAPRDALILGALGRAQLASGQPKRALATLEKARGRDFRDARLLRDLALAYAKTGQNGMASLVTAERYALLGRLKDANIHATRAAGLLPRGSGAWQRAQDVISAYNFEQKRRKRR